MKNPQSKIKTLVGVTALLLTGASSSLAQTSDLTLDSFDTGTQGSAPSGVGIWYGSCTATWDGTQDATGNGGGSLYITSLNDNTSDTPLNPYICLNGGNPWYNNPGTLDLSHYKSIEFDIKWDNSSALTVDEYNDCSTWPAIYGTPLGKFDGDPYSKAFNLKAVTGGNGTFIQLGSTNIPTSASNGWVHISFPIDPTIAGISDCNGIDLEKWDNNYSDIIGEPTVHFWIDNIVLKGTAGPPPPPTVNSPTKAVQGLNVFASTEGNTFYDRQEAELMQSSGLSWVGQATSANPVTYSFTIVGYPKSLNCEAWMFLVPNPAANDNAPDWNETNCAIFYLQGSTSTATAHFQYKVNEDHQQAMYSGGNEPRGYYTNAPGSWNGVTTNYLESGNLAALTTSHGVLGTWTVKFTSSTNGSIIAPDGSSTNFVIPAYNIGYFAEQASPAFNIYIGMQANNADAMNQAVVYSSFAVSNTASPYGENFLTDTNLDTVNTWRTSVSGGPKGVLIVPAGAPLWITWTLPDAAFTLQTSPVLNNPLAWTVPSTFPGIVPLYGLDSQLLGTNDIPPGNTAFFQLIKRQFTQLQVLLPGETNAPNTTTGKGGTPTPVPAGTIFNVTVNAVDNTFHIVPGVTDSVYLTSTDSGATLGATPPNNTMSLVNGTINIQAAFGTTGSQTISATDTTSTNIPTATSSAVTVQ